MLYTDGEYEVLNLYKQRWELIEDGGFPSGVSSYVDREVLCLLIHIESSFSDVNVLNLWQEKKADIETANASSSR